MADTQKYAKLVNGTLHPAPRAFMLHGAMVTNPKAEHFAALNEERAKQGLPPYLPEVDEPPQTDTAHYAVATGWTRDGETWRRVYEVRAYPPPPPRRWTRLAIKTALAQAGIFDAVKEYLETVYIGQSYTLWNALTDCDYVEEGYPTMDGWGLMLNGAAQALGKTRAEIDAFMSNIPAEGGV
jgi:hypothetical protein